MKLQRQVALKKKGQTYYKWVITIPSQVIETIGWKDGMDLKADTRQDRLILRPGRDLRDS